MTDRIELEVTDIRGKWRGRVEQLVSGELVRRAEADLEQHVEDAVQRRAAEGAPPQGVGPI